MSSCERLAVGPLSRRKSEVGSRATSASGSGSPTEQCLPQVVLQVVGSRTYFLWVIAKIHIGACMYQMQSQSRDRLNALQSLRRDRTCLCKAQHAPALPEPTSIYSLFIKFYKWFH
eukprot:3964289-Pleurochrysis_carterae.AAC.1